MAETQGLGVTAATTAQRVLVAGASSAVGDFVLPRLVAAGCSVIALGRKPVAAGHQDVRNTQPGWRRLDLTVSLPADLRADALVHLAPLWLLPDRLQEFAARGVNRVVALGSTSVFTKSTSMDRAEYAVAARLAQAETFLAERCGQFGMAWTLLRPTLIYGTGRDANISAIAAFIRRFGFFPVAGDATGLRSPVHADDVAQACVAALHTDAARDRSYQITGGESLTYREMVLRVFAALSVRPRLVSMPAWLMQAFAVPAALAGVAGINAELVRRMNRDQAFDSADAIRDLGYAPRPFNLTI
jgi:nucleoside-diphosphate-sugar epimerase